MPNDPSSETKDANESEAMLDNNNNELNQSQTILIQDNEIIKDDNDINLNEGENNYQTYDTDQVMQDI